MNGKKLSSDKGEWICTVIFEPEKLWKLWKEESNLKAALHLAMKYHYGDEGNGIFCNYDKAREIYEEIGESYEEYEKEEKEPIKEARLNIKGKCEEVEKLKNLLIRLNDTYGDREEVGIGFKVKHLMATLVGSPYYDGEITGAEEINKEKIKIMVNMEKPEALLYAMRQVFPELKIMKRPENISFLTN